MKYLYLLIDFSAFIIPLLFTFHPSLRFYKHLKSLFPAILLSTTAFVLWDIYFTQIGVWGFNPNYVMGFYLYNLPLEELLFFLCIPYSCLFTYHCFKILLKKDYFFKYETSITWSLVGLTGITAILNFQQLYTIASFGLLSILLVLLKFYFRVNWLSRFYFCYTILLVPFLIVNGILTGTGLDKPIVWYNNTENLNIRILTIPVEDVFYGLLLILLNVTIYEHLLLKNTKTSTSKSI